MQQCAFRIISNYQEVQETVGYFINFNQESILGRYKICSGFDIEWFCIMASYCQTI